MGEFVEDIYAAGGQSQTESKLRTVTSALAQWSFAPWPPTPAKIHALGASLKAGHYLASANYLSTYKVVAERLGYDFGSTLQRALKDAVRSCERGQGAARQSLPLPMELLHLLPGDRKPWTPGGPLSPRNC